MRFPGFTQPPHDRRALGHVSRTRIRDAHVRDVRIRRRSTFSVRRASARTGARTARSSERLDYASPGRIVVNDDCEQCGHCTATCTSNVRVHEEVRLYGMVVDPGCMKCMDCVSVCPKGVLRFSFAAPSLSEDRRRRRRARRRYDLPLSEELLVAVVGARRHARLPRPLQRPAAPDVDRPRRDHRVPSRSSSGTSSADGRCASRISS